MTKGAINETKKQPDTLQNPIKVSSLTNSGKSFKDALTSLKEREKVQNVGKINGLKPLTIPRYERGNLVVYLDQEDYKGIEELQYSVVGRLFFYQGSFTANHYGTKNKTIYNLGFGEL